jgi:acetoin utilization protein AcuB
MLVSEILSNDIFALKKNDKVSAARIFLEDWGQQQLPVVDDNNVLGFIYHEDLNDARDNEQLDKYIKPYQVRLPHLEDHPFELIKLFAQTGFSCIPVMHGQKNKFAGIVALKQLIHALGESSLAQPGAIINLELSARDYSLAELSRIIEYNDQKIIGLFLFSTDKESNKITVSIKLNNTDVKSVLAALERFGYAITSVHQYSESPSDMSGRLDWLLKYLNT